MVTEDSAPEDRATPSSGKGGGVIRGSVAPATATNSLLEAVAEQVVSEQQVVQLGQEQVVVVTEPAAGGHGGGQQILIAEGQLAPGTQVIQLQGGNGQQFVMRNLKSEPEDLSVQQQQQQPASRTINLEAGAQAIQASAAAAVQNVIRSLKDSDKMMLQQILPNHMLAQVPRGEQSIVIVEGGGGEGSDSDMVAAEVTPTKRQRSSGGSEQPPRLQIAKQYTPFGFHCILEAPTAQWVRKDEDRCTYLNKVIGYPTFVTVQASKSLIDLFAGSVLWGNT